MPPEFRAKLTAGKWEKAVPQRVESDLSVRSK